MERSSKSSGSISLLQAGHLSSRIRLQNWTKVGAEYTEEDEEVKSIAVVECTGEIRDSHMPSIEPPQEPMRLSRAFALLCLPSLAAAQSARVQSVIDGDTIVACTHARPPPGGRHWGRRRMREGVSLQKEFRN